MLPNNIDKFILQLIVWLLMLGSQNSLFAAENSGWIYTFKSGDTLSKLALIYCNNPDDWRKIQQLNAIDSDSKIPIGQKISIPLKLLKQQPASARIQHTKGPAYLIRNQHQQKLNTTFDIYKGDKIITKAGASVELQFADKSVLLILENSEVIMDTLTAWGKTGMVDTRIRLQGGRIEADVTPSKGPGSRYEIITPAAVAAVRGTRFRVGADDQLIISRSEVLEGKVYVRNKLGTMDVASGYGLVAQAETPLTPPRKLLSAVNLANNTNSQLLPPYHFAWSEVEEAVIYSVQLESPNKTEEILVGHPRISWDTLANDHYTLTVRAIDEYGLKGLDSTFDFNVNTPLPAPELKTIADNGVLRNATPDFEWQVISAATSYQFEIASDPQFNNIVQQQSTDTPSISLPQPLQPGKYYWHVASNNTIGLGHYSEAQAIAYIPLPAAADNIEVNHTANQLKLTWQAIENANRYFIQLATDRNFTQIIATDYPAAANTWLLRPTKAGTYYLRIRAANSQGEYGPYSAVQAVNIPASDSHLLWLFSLPALLLLL